MTTSSLSIVALVLLLGCGGQPADPAGQGSDSVHPAVLEDASLAQTWAVRMADAQARAPFEAQSGWAQIFQRDYPKALSSFGTDAPEGRARVHVELAAMYRQAALLAARSTVQVYGNDRQAVDPVEVDYLLMASAGLLGDCDLMKQAAQRLPRSLPATLQAPADWWRAQPCPVDLANIPMDLFPGAPGPVDVARLPGPGELPHFRLTEQSDEAREVRATDPTSLVVLSRWHQAAAQQVAPEGQGDAIPWLLAVWRMPGEALPVTSPPKLDDAWLFASFMLAGPDAAFLAQASQDGVAAVTAWQDRSPLAAVLVPAIVDGEVVTDKVLDQSAWLGQQIETEMARKAGQEEAFHRAFADLARVSVLRAGMVVADASGAYRDAGVLRINALERSTGPAADPVFQMSVAAWDAGNRNPLRAQDLLHGLLSRYPAVETARYPLDAMHVRLSRNAAPATPVH